MLVDQQKTKQESKNLSKERLSNRIMIWAVNVLLYFVSNVQFNERPIFQAAYR